MFYAEVRVPYDKDGMNYRILPLDGVNSPASALSLAEELIEMKYPDGVITRVYLHQHNA